MISRVFGIVGKPIKIHGSAYDFGHAVHSIEFSLDEGIHWTRYETPGTNDYQNMTWTFVYTPEQPGLHVLRVRAVNDEGQASPKSARVEILVEDA